MRWVRPEVHLIAKSHFEKDEHANWLVDRGVSDETVQRMQAADKTDAEVVIESAGRRCYMSFEVGLNPNVTKIREDVAEYIDNVLKSGHGSVLEHATFTFAIENVSRVFTGEMNRHRAGVAISEGSMRFIRFTDIPMVETDCLRTDEFLRDLNGISDLENKVLDTREAFQSAVDAAEKAYAKMLEIWKSELAPESKFAGKKAITSMMRRIVPMGVATGGLWTLNLRALRHICELRTTPHAEEEILEVALMILEIMRKEEPSFFGDFKLLTDGWWVPKYHKV